MQRQQQQQSRANLLCLQRECTTTTTTVARAKSLDPLEQLVATAALSLTCCLLRLIDLLSAELMLKNVATL